MGEAHQVRENRRALTQTTTAIASAQTTASNGAGSGIILAARSVTVDYPGTRAVDDVSVEVRPGDVLGVVGANGSGKTTLVSVLCGLRRPTAGHLEDATGKISFHSPGDALARGVTLVPQEPQLAGPLSCWENITLGHPVRFGVTLIDRRARDRARSALAEALPHIDPSARADTLRKADRAILALLSALARRPRLLALDEPTAVLGEQAVSVVSSAVEQVGNDNGAVILVSHRLRDIIALATRILVLVDGRATFETETSPDLTVDALVEQLTHGRAPAAKPEARQRVASERSATEQLTPRLSVTGLTTSNGLHVDRLEVHEGEIVGLAGLGGSGRSRLLRVLTGAAPFTGGEIRFDGVAFGGDVRAARRAGAAYVAEDRAADGMFAPLSVARNATIGQLVGGRSLLTLASRVEERKLAQGLIRRFSIKTPHVYSLITALSGGNQQRVMLARALAGKAGLLLADEPTQGVDIHGRSEIQEQLTQFAADGGAVLFASSDFDELLSLCTRIVVIRDGITIGAQDPSETDYRSLVALTSGAQVGLLPHIELPET